MGHHYSARHSSGVRVWGTLVVVVGVLAAPAASDPITIAVSRAVGVVVPPPTLTATRSIGVYKNPCAGDWNFDGELNSQDFFDFLACFLGGNCPGNLTGDYNGDGIANSQDFFDFLSAFFDGC